MKPTPDDEITVVYSQRGFLIVNFFNENLIIDPRHLWVQNVKTTCEKSWSVYLLQVLMPAFDPSLKVHWVILLKMPHISLIKGPRALNSVSWSHN